jgi:selenocysteine lyase/cysteine desulfurase
MPMTIHEARALWQPEGIYLNTASFGLPPRPAWDALQAALDDWRVGRTSWEHWGDATEAARAHFARLCGVPVEWIAVGGSVSGLVGLLAASIPDGARVISTDVEFTSLLWPFMAQGRGVEVSCVPVARLAEAVDARTDVVAFSAVQSSTGELADLDAVAAAAAHHGALTVVDATHACGWLPFDGGRFDAFIGAAYKWLMSPRGTAFMGVRPGLLERLTPHAAGWYAGDDPHSSYYGPPLRLANTARRLDTSPAWFAWVGTAPALDVVLRIGVEAIYDHDLRLANLFRAGLGLEPGDSAIVSADVPGAEERLRGTGVMAAARAGRLRTSWHVYNTEEDVERMLELLRLSPAAARRSLRGSAGGMTSAAPGATPFTTQSRRTIGG